MQIIIYKSFKIFEKQRQANMCIKKKLVPKNVTISDRIDTRTGNVFGHYS